MVEVVVVVEVEVVVVEVVVEVTVEVMVEVIVIGKGDDGGSVSNSGSDRGRGSIRYNITRH